MSDVPDPTRPRSSTRFVVAAFLVLQIAAMVGGEAASARYARLLWPFNDAAMFTTDVQSGKYNELELRLASGATETPLPIGEVIHPSLDIGQWALEFRIERTPSRWDESLDRGLARAANRFRCARGLAADAVVIARVYQTRDERLRGAPLSAREIVRRVELPRCP